MKTYKLKINGNAYEVAINSIEGNIADVPVNGASYQVEMENAPAAAVAAPAVQAPAAQPAVFMHRYSLNTISGKRGEAVKAGHKVAVIEAMKMENEISATKDGTISAIHVSKGDSVLEGADVVSIA